jgi:hypothetical protein
LLEDSTGEEYERLKFELDRPNDPRGCLADGKRLITFVSGVISIEHVPRPNKPDAHMPRWTGEMIVWDVATGRKLLRWPLGNVTPATFLDLSPDGRRLLTSESSDDENARFRIRLWDLESMLRAEGLSPSRPRL